MDKSSTPEIVARARRRLAEKQRGDEGLVGAEAKSPTKALSVDQPAPASDTEPSTADVSIITAGTHNSGIVADESQTSAQNDDSGVASGGDSSILNQSFRRRGSVAGEDIPTYLERMERVISEVEEEVHAQSLVNHGERQRRRLSQGYASRRVYGDPMNAPPEASNLRPESVADVPLKSPMLLGASLADIRRAPSSSAILRYDVGSPDEASPRGGPTPDRAITTVHDTPEKIARQVHKARESSNSGGSLSSASLGFSGSRIGIASLDQAQALVQASSSSFSRAAEATTPTAGQQQLVESKVARIHNRLQEVSESVEQGLVSPEAAEALRRTMENLGRTVESMRGSPGRGDSLRSSIGPKATDRIVSQLRASSEAIRSAAAASGEPRSPSSPMERHHQPRGALLQPPARSTSPGFEGWRGRKEEEEAGEAALQGATASPLRQELLPVASFQLRDSDDMCRTDGSPLLPSDDQNGSRPSAAARVKSRLAAAARSTEQVLGSSGGGAKEPEEEAADGSDGSVLFEATMDAPMTASAIGALKGMFAAAMRAEGQEDPGDKVPWERGSAGREVAAEERPGRPPSSSGAAASVAELIAVHSSQSHSTFVPECGSGSELEEAVADESIVVSEAGADGAWEAEHVQRCRGAHGRGSPSPACSIASEEGLPSADDLVSAARAWTKQQMQKSANGLREAEPPIPEEPRAQASPGTDRCASPVSVCNFDDTIDEEDAVSSGIGSSPLRHQQHRQSGSVPASPSHSSSPASAARLAALKRLCSPRSSVEKVGPGATQHSPVSHRKPSVAADALSDPQASASPAPNATTARSAGRAGAAEGRMTPASASGATAKLPARRLQALQKLKGRQRASSAHCHSSNHAPGVAAAAAATTAGSAAAAGPRSNGNAPGMASSAGRGSAVAPKAPSAPGLHLSTDTAEQWLRENHVQPADARGAVMLGMALGLHAPPQAIIKACATLSARLEGIRIRRRLNHRNVRALRAEILDLCSLVEEVSSSPSNKESARGLDSVMQSQAKAQLRSRRLQLREALDSPAALRSLATTAPTRTQQQRPASAFPGGLTLQQRRGSVAASHPPRRSAAPSAPRRRPVAWTEAEEEAAEAGGDPGGASARASEAEAHKSRSSCAGEAEARDQQQQQLGHGRPGSNLQRLRALGNRRRPAGAAEASTLNCAADPPEGPQRGGGGGSVAPGHDKGNSRQLRGGKGPGVGASTQEHPVAAEENRQPQQADPKPFLKRQTRSYKISQAPDYSAVRSRLDSRLDSRYIPRNSSKQRPASAVPTKQGQRKAGKNRSVSAIPSFSRHHVVDPAAEPFEFHHAAPYQDSGRGSMTSRLPEPCRRRETAYSLSPELPSTSSYLDHVGWGDASHEAEHHQILNGSGGGGSLDDILGQVNSLLTEVNSILHHS